MWPRDKKQCRIECLHALLLAEARIFGLQFVWPALLESDAGEADCRRPTPV